MKIIRPISNEEMEETHGDLMDALRAGPNDVEYCMECDGFRLKGHHGKPE